MRAGRLILMAVVALLVPGVTSHARVSHGDSATFAIDTVTAVDDGTAGPPRASRIDSASPNPFNPRTTIDYELAAASTIRLAIYDVRGMLVRQLAAGAWSAGRYQATWNGMDDAGQAAPSGTYFCRLTLPDGYRTVKLALTR